MSCMTKEEETRQWIIMRELIEAEVTTSFTFPEFMAMVDRFRSRQVLPQQTEFETQTEQLLYFLKSNTLIEASEVASVLKQCDSETKLKAGLAFAEVEDY